MDAFMTKMAAALVHCKRRAVERRTRALRRAENSARALTTAARCGSTRERMRPFLSCFRKLDLRHFDILVYKRHDKRMKVEAKLAREVLKSKHMNPELTMEQLEVMNDPVAKAVVKEVKDAADEELREASRNRCGIILTVLFPLLLVAWGLGLGAQEIWFKNGSLQPFNDGESLCMTGAGLTRVSTARTGNPGDTLSARYAGYYNIELEPWVGAGAPLGNDTRVASTTCDAGNGGTTRGGVRRPGKYRDLGVFPVCPFSQTMKLGAWEATSPIGGLGFVLQTPILGDKDLNGATWDMGGCLTEGFTAELLPSDDGRLRGLGFDRVVPVNFTDESSMMMNQAVSQYSTWVRDSDMADRMPVVQYSLSLDHTLRKGFLGDPAKINNLQSLKGTWEGGAIVVDAMRARAYATPAELRATSINHLLWQRLKTCVAMQTCGDRVELSANDFITFSTAVQDLGRNTTVARLLASNATAGALVLSYALGNRGDQLARDAGWAPSQISDANVTALAAALAMVVPQSIVDAVSLPRQPFDAGAGMDLATACAMTYHNRSEWQRLSTGCGFTCGQPLVGRPLNLTAQRVLTDDDKHSVLLFTQRFTPNLRCGLSDSSVRPLDAFAPTNTTPDGGLFRIRRDDAGGREFVRGPALTMAIIFRTSDTFTLVKENFSTMSPMSIFTQTMGMSGSFLAVLLLVKVVYDLGPFKAPCRSGGCCHQCVVCCCPVECHKRCCLDDDAEVAVAATAAPPPANAPRLAPPSETGDPSLSSGPGTGAAKPDGAPEIV